MKPAEVVAFETAFRERLASKLDLNDPDENLFRLNELEKVRNDILGFYAAHPEHLDTADENVRRHFGLDMSKYGNWKPEEFQKYA